MIEMADRVSSRIGKILVRASDFELQPRQQILTNLDLCEANTSMRAII